MADISCTKCKHTFNNNNSESLVTRAAASTVCAGAGFWFGGSVGLVAGPLGGMSGAIPGAMVGSITGWFTADQFRRCPQCRHVFKT